MNECIIYDNFSVHVAGLSCVALYKHTAHCFGIVSESESPSSDKQSCSSLETVDAFEVELL